jgi:molecular chaperone IbpA
MRTYDLSPLFRSTVGFDRLSQLLDSVQRVDETSLGYPPYNIEKLSEDAYRITMAVAGFTADEIEVITKDGAVVVSGKAKAEEKPQTFLHQGIARRAFERRFQLADHIKVTGASLNNGLLDIELVREVPETLKPRRIAVNAGNSQVLIDRSAA